MQQTPLVSIIVPNYNHAKFLNQRLDSIFNQTFKDFEVIFLDDKSPDNSVGILNSYQDDRITHRVYNTTNSGSTFKQWKKGLELAKGDLIWIAESDDFADITFLEKMLPIFTDYPNVALAYCDMNYINENNKIIDTLSQSFNFFHPTFWEDNHYELGINYIKDYMLVSNFIPNASGVIFRKDLGLKHIDKVLEYKTSGDSFLWSAILSEKGYYVYFRGKEKLNYFRHHSQTTRNHNTYEKKQKRVIDHCNITYQVLEMSNLMEEKLEQKRKDILYWWAKEHSISKFLQNDFCKILETPIFRGMSSFELYKYYIKFKIREFLR